MTARYGLRGSYRLIDTIEATGRYKLTDADRRRGRHRLPRTRLCLPGRYSLTDRGQSSSVYMSTGRDRLTVKCELKDKAQRLIGVDKKTWKN